MMRLLKREHSNPELLERWRSLSQRREPFQAAMMWETDKPVTRSHEGPALYDHEADQKQDI